MKPGRKEGTREVCFLLSVAEPGYPLSALSLLTLLSDCVHMILPHSGMSLTHPGQLMYAAILRVFHFNFLWFSSVFSRF